MASNEPDFEEKTFEAQRASTITHAIWSDSDLTCTFTCC